MKRLLLINMLSLLLTVGFCSGVRAQGNESYNPIIKHLYTCDPSTLVDQDTLYIITGVEKTDTPYNWPFKISSWHIFSTVDMKNFQDHGAVLDASAFEWMRDNECWASQIVKKQDKYYWYVCSWGSVGVAVADHILGPYRDALGKPLVDRTMPGFDVCNIDPTVYVDEDGSAYIYWGGEAHLFGCKLKDNMVEFDGEPLKISGLKNYEEAPWLFKRDSLYYLAYSTSNGYTKGPIRYATSTTPLGPWEDREDILGVVYNSFTNHEAIVEYKGKWYIVYHNGALPGGGDYNRSVCIDRLHFNADGTIQFVEQTTGGPEGQSGYNNFGPHAYAGVDATCLLRTGVVLNSRIIDDGRMKEDLSWKWEVQEGPGEISVDLNSVKDHRINFSEAGDYTLRLSVSDGYAESSDEVHVRVYAEPEEIVTESDSLPCELSVKKKGLYTVHLYYNSGRRESTDLEVNGQRYPVVFERTQFGYTPSCAILRCEVELNKGINTFRLAEEKKGLVSKVQITQEK